MKSGSSSARLTPGEPLPSTVRLESPAKQSPAHESSQEADDNVAIQMDAAAEHAAVEPDAAEPQDSDAAGNTNQEENDPQDSASKPASGDKALKKAKSVKINPTPREAKQKADTVVLSPVDSCFVGIRRKLLPDQPKYVPAAKKLWEIVFYVAFLVNLSCVTLLMQDTHSFFLFNHSIRASIVDAPFPQTSGSPVTINFQSIGSWGDFWSFMKKQFIPSLLDSGTASCDGVKCVLGSNILIGRVKLRQLRVRSDIKCSLPSQFKISDCIYAPRYDEAYEQRNFTTSTGKKFKYTKGELRYSSIYASVLAKYPDGGFFAKISDDHDEATAEIEELEAMSWLDSFSRAIFLDFTLYNPPSKLVSHTRLVVETSEFGGFYTSSFIRTLSPFRVYTTRGMILLGFEGLLFIFVWYYTFQEIKDMFTQGIRDYFRDKWSIMDILSLMMFYLQFSLEAYIYYEVDSKLKNLPYDEKFDFFEMSFIQEQVKSIIAINTVVCFFRIFKYVSVHKRMGELTRTLSFARDDILYFMVMFIIIFWGFTQAFHISFGSNVSKFNTLEGTLYALFTSILGEIALSEITQDNRVLGPVLFFSFILLVFFVMLNMYLAIINQSYDEVRKAPPDDDHKILQAYIRQKYRQLRVKYLGGTKEPEAKANETKTRSAPPLWSQSSRVLPLESADRLQSYQSRRGKSERVIKVEAGEKDITVKEAGSSSSGTGPRGSLKQEAKLSADNGRNDSGALDPSKLDILIEAVTSSVRQVAPSGGSDTGRSMELMQESLVNIDGKFEKLYVKLEDLILILLEQNQSGQGGGNDDNGDDDYT